MVLNKDEIDVGGEAQLNTAVMALVRVAGHYGLTLDRQQLLRAYPFDAEEPNPAVLLKMVKGVGLHGKLMRVQRGELARLSRLLPAILLLPNGKAAVLNRIQQQNGASFALIDELESERGLTVLLDEPRLFEFWAGDVILIKVDWRKAGVDRPFGFRWLVDQIVRERNLFRDIVIAAFFMSVLALFLPLTFMVVLDRVLTNQSMSTLQVLGVVLLSVISFETMFGYLRRYLVWVATSRIDARINLYVFDK